MLLERSDEDASVYQLINKLCKNTAAKYCDQNGASQSQLAGKMKTNAYEILLKKTTTTLPKPRLDPICNLLSYYYIANKSCKNVAEFKRCTDLKNIIFLLRQNVYGPQTEMIHIVIQFLTGLSNSIKPDFSDELYHSPFSFRLLDEMLPKPHIEPFGSPQPYAYYPSHVFELPFSMMQQDNLCTKLSKTYSKYSVERFDSQCYGSDTHMAQFCQLGSPMSIASMQSGHVSPYTDNIIFNYPRLTDPRDLVIPLQEVNFDVSTSTPRKTALNFNKVYQAKQNDVVSDIWELASQVDKEIPNEIWDTVSKMPLSNERQLIAMSNREVALWRHVYNDQLSTLHIISEKQFLRHIMYLIIGVETSSFLINKEANCFYLRDDLVLEGISKEHLKEYVSKFLIIGTYYKRLYKFAFNESLNYYFESNGLVYEAAREAMRRYLLDFRLVATEIYNECCDRNPEATNCIPTLLQLMYHLEPLSYEIDIVASIYKIDGQEATSSLPYGAELMSYLFNEISLVTHPKTSRSMFNTLFSVCSVYFKFIEKFIFEGELEDNFHEFFIKKDSNYINSYSKRYWDKGFYLTQSMAVPDFLRSLAKFILLCGKSLRLLKLCNPCDPLVLLISTDHPTVVVCSSFQELERQQQLLAVYRTRCLFVSGEPVTFEQIMLKREAEKKAFAEMASLKQAETMEKIIAERKRLAQLIIAEKQHSFKVLEAAMAETKAAKNKSRLRQRKLNELEAKAQKASEEVDSKIREDERFKIMEYYSKLNMEVEKSKVHTEWKIKRLQLDQSRMQLLSTEERNFKREKLELDHKRSEEVMAMSIESDSRLEDNLDNDSPACVENIVVPESHNLQNDINGKNESKESLNSSSDVFSVICNAAKSIFGYKTAQICDNKKLLDAQGNIISDETLQESKTSNDVIGLNLPDYNKIEYFNRKHEALMNKRKVMAHEFGQIDTENNQLPNLPIHKDEENNDTEMTPFEEAKKNKRKVLGADMADNITKPVIVINEPRTNAQKEALLNKKKVLGVEYNLPWNETTPKEPANEAQIAALQNKKKMHASDCHSRGDEHKTVQSKKAGLTLNLKPESSIDNEVSPEATTPCEIYSRLDLETPTTSDIPLREPMAGDIFTPRSDRDADLESAKSKSDRKYNSCEGFQFSVLVDEVTATEMDGYDDVIDTSPEKNTFKEVVKFSCSSKSIFSAFDDFQGSDSLEDLDPFGIKVINKFSTQILTDQTDGYSECCYTHPSVIMEEVKKQPYVNIFLSHLDEVEDDTSVNCDNIATLSACLQRSVMLPLTYQLEVVNNAILTHFLMNLDMYEHLRSLKDYFFLMDGEFSGSICKNLFTKLVKTISPQELLNFATLQSILDKAVGSSISHIHKFSENLSFNISESPLSFQHSSPDVLKCLSLSYSVSWPLNIILSQEALLRYDKVFQFLIKMRRISWVLSQDFETLKMAVKVSRQYSRMLLRSPQYISIQIFRHIMASLIRALDNYIVTTCILSPWNEFELDLKKARTLDDLYDCHVVYIKKVLFRCLLNNRSVPVMKLLNDIFTVILKFSRVLKAGDWFQKESNGNFNHPNYVQLEELYHLFEKLTKYLHKVIIKLMECGYQRHLVELLSMINLNGYYNINSIKSVSVEAT